MALDVYEMNGCLLVPKGDTLTIAISMKKGVSSLLNRVVVPHKGKYLASTFTFDEIKKMVSILPPDARRRLAESLL